MESGLGNMMSLEKSFSHVNIVQTLFRFQTFYTRHPFANVYLLF